ncbi:MAG TPA: TetR family transcriptional regulator [Actinomycetes bacterium]|jgi:AcrR family transcriptional regulator
MTAGTSATAAPGRERKSDRTRAAILNAARAQFQQHGYDRTSIRAVAAAAEIDPSMVMRYFGSKEGLFAAAAHVDLQLPNLGGVPVRQRGQALLEHFIRRWEGDLSDDVLVLLLRSAVTDERAAQRLQAVFQEQLVDTLSRMSGPEEALRRAGLIASQVLGVALGRYLLRLPGLADRPPADLVADLAPTIQRYLTGRLPATTKQ